jgi:hypothetical protein
MVAGGEDPSAATAKTPDGQALRGREPFPLVEREEPQLIEVRLVEPGKNRIVGARRCLAVACGDAGAKAFLPQ